jgi:hypothetical protein
MAARRVPRLLCPSLGRGWLEAHSWSASELASCAAFDGTPSGLALAALPAADGAGTGAADALPPQRGGRLAVKRSTSRFFMYEEHRDARYHAKLRDASGATEVIAMAAPDFFGTVLQPKPQPTTERWLYHYWTSPIADVAPDLLQRLPGWERLHRLPPAAAACQEKQQEAAAAAAVEMPIDPRGPSLWVGSEGSGTQAHYDVADNVIVQLHGTKRVRCYPPSAHEALHVFPDAHPRARKSQLDFDRLVLGSGTAAAAADDDDEDDGGSGGGGVDRRPSTPPPSSSSFEGEGRRGGGSSSGEQGQGQGGAGGTLRRRFPGSAALGAPYLDVVLQPGDALSVPAFWFHHLENGCCVDAAAAGAGNSGGGGGGPSVSLNLFALSAPMMAAQAIFREGRPLEGDGKGGGGGEGGRGGAEGRGGVPHANLASERFAVAALHRLVTALVEGLALPARPRRGAPDPAGEAAGAVEQLGGGGGGGGGGGALLESPRGFVRRLLDSRYAPLGAAEAAQEEAAAQERQPLPPGGVTSMSSTRAPPLTSSSSAAAAAAATVLTAVEEEMAGACVGRLLRHFGHLRGSVAAAPAGGGQVGGDADDDEQALVELVAMHLIELWATALRGAPEVERTLRAAFEQL